MKNEGAHYFSYVERKELSTPNPILAKISFRNERELKIFVSKTTLKEYRRKLSKLKRKH